MSLGSRSDGTDDQQYRDETNQRIALRALLMCQRVFLSSLWAKAFFGFQAETYGPTPAYRPSNWKTDSLNHWRSRSEVEIGNAISLFKPVQNVQRGRLAEVARFGFPNKFEDLRGKLTLSRTDMNALINYANTICYDAILPWLMQSGIASMRWLVLTGGLSEKNPCERIFGQGEEIWNENRPFDRNTDNLPVIPEGYLIHMWDVDAAAKRDGADYNGHWVISNGDGTVTGINNGEVNTQGETNPRIPKEFIEKRYTDNASLINQFWGYKKIWDSDGLVIRGRMVRHDPLTLPGLC